jgi:hypothetical protein
MFQTLICLCPHMKGWGEPTEWHPAESTVLSYWSGDV